MINKKGFTLSEVIIVVVIIGVVAALAIPRYGEMMERMRAEQAKRVLEAIFMAQLDYEMETGQCADATEMALLSVEVASSDDFFYWPYPCDWAAQISCGKNIKPTYAQAKRKDNSYWLFMRGDGEILCAASSCATNVCDQFDFIDVQDL